MKSHVEAVYSAVRPLIMQKIADAGLAVDYGNYRIMWRLAKMANTSSGLPMWEETHLITFLDGFAGYATNYSLEHLEFDYDDPAFPTNLIDAIDVHCDNVLRRRLTKAKSQ